MEEVANAPGLFLISFPFIFLFDWNLEFLTWSFSQVT